MKDLIVTQDKVATNSKISKKTYDKDNAPRGADVVLLTKHSMLPVVKSLMVKKPSLQTVPKRTLRIVKAQKYRSKQVLSLLEPPRKITSTFADEPCKVYNHLHESLQSRTGRNTVAKKSLSKQSRDTHIIENFIRLRLLDKKIKNNELPFPNIRTTANVSPILNKESVEAERNFHTTVPLSTMVTPKTKYKKGRKHFTEIFCSLKDNVIIPENFSNLDSNPHKLVSALKNNVRTKNKELDSNFTKLSDDNTKHTATSKIPLVAMFTPETKGKRSFSDTSIGAKSVDNTISVYSPTVITNNKDYVSTEEKILVTSSNYEAKVSEIKENDKRHNVKPNQQNLNGKRSYNVMRDLYENTIIKDMKNSQMKAGDVTSFHSNSKDISVHETKYSWQDINNWIPPCQKEEALIKAYRDKYGVQYPVENFDCKIKYSWQVIGTGAQTSRTLLDDLLNESNDSVASKYRCEIKYSWQIIGTSTQISLQSDKDTDYWNGKLVAPSEHYNDRNTIDINANKCTNNKYNMGQGLRNKYVILNNQNTQTIMDKENQTQYTDCRVTYSWHNDLKKYLHNPQK